MATLLLRLAGPLQSWGDESKFNERRTVNFPTKSGVIGMLVSAFGYSREASSEVLKDFNKLKFGIRIDREGKIIRDYHIAKPLKKDAYITNRFYIADAVFLAGFESDDTEFLYTIENALKNPAFPLYLGRRSCPPAVPLVLGVRETGLLDSLKNEEWLLDEWRQNRVYDDSERRLRIIADSDDGSGAMLRDVPLSLDIRYRKFDWRCVKDYGYIDKSKIVSSTEHDAFKELG